MSVDEQIRETDGAVVSTTLGKLRGVSRNGVEIFRGIPYAAPPTGDRRFRAPAPAAGWSGIREAKAWPESCPQERRFDTGLLRWYRSAMTENEDCLYLNVFTPAPDGKKRPVMVWYHGGAFATGAGTAPGFEGSALARRGDVVVVTVNHRLNVFGYFHPGPDADDNFADSANAGMLDLVASLEWVRDNIAAFGGDPDSVTIFGESGGGGKVGRLLHMPAAKGLFHRAILQSSGLRSATPEQGSKAAAHLLEQFGWTPAEAAKLRDVPSDKLLAARLKTVDALGFDPFEPIPDGHNLPEAPFSEGAPEISAGIPIMIGTCNNEAYYLLIEQKGAFEMTREDAVGRIQALNNLEKAAAEEIYTLYDQKTPGNKPVDVYADVLTDQRFRMNSLRCARLKAEQGTAPAYLYRFTWNSPAQGGKYRAIHTIEVPFVFGTMDTATELVGTGPELGPLCDKVMGAWIAFARTGDPNAPGLPQWDPYDGETCGTMLLDIEPTFVQDPPGPELQALAGNGIRASLSRTV
ncbi:carboxylesterase/lipase family protein [Oceanicola sp. 22II-s10i]|uniref:carboxylesterase/lipase family protein n=1 Tax=Oceanicola sp. 22II-s10i TaxID=1317116 RepID=UPI001594EB8A|nr:carboxylesterase/lipase family protein [Oceanicola sp. 22II-s10i]